MIKQRLRQLGQGMTEYIIIVALIAIAAIAIYTLFGDAIRGQMGVMTKEITGVQGGTVDSGIATKAETADNAKTLKDFQSK